MPDREPIALCWSGGKDSSLAWHALREDGRYRVEVLVTTITETYDRVSMHGVRRPLVETQAEALGLPLETVWIPPKANNEIYETRMANVFQHLKEVRGIRTVAFGDIFLEDLKAYREKQFHQLKMDCLFPLWKRDTTELAREFCELGFRGVTVCVDPKRLVADFIGREMDQSFFADLPGTCDPCGENGEYHSFIYNAPAWLREIPITKGEIALRDSFLYCDLLPRTLETVSPT